MSKLGKTITEVGDAAKSTQKAQKEGLRQGREQVRLGREELYGAAGIGLLLAVALLLLIVLETQWIRAMHRKLKSPA